MRPVLSALVMVMGRALSNWATPAHLEAARDVQRTGEHKAMTNVLARRPVIARAECIQLPGLRSALQFADTVHIVKEFAEQASPRLRLGERVVRDQVEAARVALQMQHQRVVAGAVVGLEHGGRGKRKRAITVVSLLMGVVGAHQPVLVEGVLGTAGDVDGVGRLVVGIDERRRRCGIRVHRFKRSSPAVLSQIVVEHAKSGAKHGVSARCRENKRFRGAERSACDSRGARRVESAAPAM